MDDEIEEAVDNLVEELEGSAEREAKRLGIEGSEMLDRIANEIKARQSLGG